MIKKNALTSGRLLGRKFFPRRSIQLRRPVVLIGLDSDETRRVAFHLAQSLGLVAVDCDNVIQYSSGCTLTELIAERGEAAYRRLERQVIETTLASSKPCVLAAGDGALIDSEVRALVTGTAHLVALTRNLTGCFEHLKARPGSPDSWHPLFSGPLTSESQMQYFYQARSAAIEAAAEAVDMRDMTARSAAQELAARWSSRSRLAS